MKQVEFTPDEWSNRPPELRSIEIDHQCRTLDECDVFVCRDSVGYSCGRYVCGAVGNADDNRCADCVNKLEAALPALLLQHLAERAWAREDTMCRHFGLYERNRMVEDALFKLVEQRTVTWHGSADKPLRYKITRQGRVAAASHTRQPQLGDQQ